jgi:hypothetical protein
VSLSHGNAAAPRLLWSFARERALRHVAWPVPGGLYWPRQERPTRSGGGRGRESLFSPFGGVQIGSRLARILT